MEELVTDLEAILAAEFDALTAFEELPGSAVANIVREVDYVYLYLHGGKQFSAAYTDYFETLHQYGWPLLLQAWFAKIRPTELQPVQNADWDLSGWADARIHAAGQIARCRQLILFYKMGFGEFHRPSEAAFTFTITAPYANTEAYDLLDFRYIQKAIIDKNIHKHKAREQFSEAVVEKRLNTSVRRPEGLTIQYHATAYVADYFARQGHYHLSRLQVDDDFGPTDEFGGVPYGAYVKMMEHLAARQFTS